MYKLYFQSSTYLLSVVRIQVVFSIFNLFTLICSCTICTFNLQLIYFHLFVYNLYFKSSTYLLSVVPVQFLVYIFNLLCDVLYCRIVAVKLHRIFNSLCVKLSSVKLCLIASHPLHFYCERNRLFFCFHVSYFIFDYFVARFWSQSKLC